MKYTILILFLCLSGCATSPRADPGTWYWEQTSLRNKLADLKEENAFQKREIEYLEKQLKAFYKWNKMQDKIYGQ